MGKKRESKKHHDWHHRKPRSLGSPAVCDSNDSDNLSHVSTSKHRAWHTLFSNLEAFEIAAIINSVWLDPDYLFIVKRKKQ